MKLTIWADDGDDRFYAYIIFNSILKILDPQATPT